MNLEIFPDTPRKIAKYCKDARDNGIELAEVLPAIEMALEHAGLEWIRRGATTEQLVSALRGALNIAKMQGAPSDKIMPQYKLVKFAARLIREYEDSCGYKRDDVVYKRPNNIRGDLQKMERLMSERTAAFSFGIPDFDAALGGGAMRGQLMSIVGAPGAMKTSLMLAGIETWIKSAEPDDTIALFSLDMYPEEIYMRILQRRLHCGVDVLNRLRATNAVEYRNAFDEVVRDYDGRLFLLTDTDTVRLEQVAEFIQKNCPSLVCVDYLTMLEDKLATTDYTLMRKTVTTLKRLTRKLLCTTVILSQMGMEARRLQAQGTFTGGGARGGGYLSEVADFDIELNMATRTDMYGETERKLVATITKNRRGTANTSWCLDVNPATQVFSGDSYKLIRRVKQKDSPFENF